jgi:hypothetical protein
LILEELEFYRRKEQEKANTEAEVHAIAWAGLFGSFGDSKVDWVDFVPFPELLRKPTLKSQMSGDTFRICKRLIDNGTVLPEIAAIMIDLDSRLV